MTILPSHVPYATDTIDEEDEDEQDVLEPAEAFTPATDPAADPAAGPGAGATAAVGGAGEGALGDPLDGSGPGNQGREPDGPWVLLVTRAGVGKRVPVRSFPIQHRRGMGRSGIRLNPDDALAAVHVVRPMPSLTSCSTCKQPGLLPVFPWMADDMMPAADQCADA